MSLYNENNQVAQLKTFSYLTKLDCIAKTTFEVKTALLGLILTSYLKYISVSPNLRWTLSPPIPLKPLSHGYDRYDNDNYYRFQNETFSYLHERELVLARDLASYMITASGRCV